MKAMTEGHLYLLKDGTAADPKDCAKGDDGVLRHKDGREVSVTDEGEPLTLASNAALSGASAAADGSTVPDEVEPPADVADRPPVKD